MKHKEDPNQGILIELPESLQKPRRVKRITSPIWTENKSRLIERYLYYFVLITKHGTYIDGFAGPQRPDKPEMWSAKLVLESEPRWLRSFYLFDRDTEQTHLLRCLRDNQPVRSKGEPKRSIEIFEGDFNQAIQKLLQRRCIREKEATFCLLDQRTFECQWTTVESLANYKPSGMKIELFYFLPNSWLDRALYASKDDAVLTAWWGRNDWQELKGMPSQKRAEVFCQRFRELGYRDVKPWPIYENQHSQRTMYYMIHATDHNEGPRLMRRAYERAVEPKEEPEQFLLDLGLDRRA